MTSKNIEKAYKQSQALYAEHGVDTERALQKLENISLSLHCWQGDDVGGFENQRTKLEAGGLLVTGNYPGKPRTLEELRNDLDKAFSLIPGHHRLNLHAIYGEFSGKRVDRNEISEEHFRSWVKWAWPRNLKLDFNATCFSHPKASSGFTLSSKENAIRRFWIDHVKRCRKISAFMGCELKSPCLHNLWIPDGSKEIPVNRSFSRALLKESLDEVFEVEYSPQEMRDSLESKLFGIGSESFVVGSHEFYLGYALLKQKWLCLDLGHFHPTESVADKVSAILPFLPGIVLHLSRGVRWDSDHVVILNDEIRQVTEEIVRGQVLDRIHIALDFFDASLNRVGAWILGARATLKGLLLALLQPEKKLKEKEKNGNKLELLALQEEFKSMPLGSVWDYYCLTKDVPPGTEWFKEIDRYEKEVLRLREV